MILVWAREVSQKMERSRQSLNTLEVEQLTPGDRVNGGQWEKVSLWEKK